MYTEAQKRANIKYNKNFEPITLKVPKGKKEIYRQHAKKKNKSLTQLIIELLEKEINAGEK